MSDPPASDLGAIRRRLEMDIHWAPGSARSADTEAMFAAFDAQAARLAVLERYNTPFLAQGRLYWQIRMTRARVRHRWRTLAETDYPQACRWERASHRLAAREHALFCQLTDALDTLSEAGEVGAGEACAACANEVGACEQHREDGWG